MVERMSLTAAAKMLGWSPQKLKRYIITGQIGVGKAYPPVYEGGKWYYDIRKDKVEDYANGRL